MCASKVALIEKTHEKSKTKQTRFLLLLFFVLFYLFIYLLIIIIIIIIIIIFLLLLLLLLRLLLLLLFKYQHPTGRIIHTSYLPVAHWVKQ